MIKPLSLLTRVPADHNSQLDQVSGFLFDSHTVFLGTFVEEERLNKDSIAIDKHLTKTKV